MPAASSSLAGRMTIEVTVGKNRSQVRLVWSWSLSRENADADTDYDCDDRHREDAPHRSMLAATPGSLSTNEGYTLGDLPDVIGHASGHPRNAWGRVGEPHAGPSEVVLHEVQGYGSGQVFDLALNALVS